MRFDLCGLRFSQSNTMKRRVQSYRVESIYVWYIWIAVSTNCLCVSSDIILCTLVLQRNLSKVAHVDWLLVYYKCTLWAPVLGRTPSNVTRVANVLLWAKTWSGICALILGRNHSNVKHVDYAVHWVEIWRNICARCRRVRLLRTWQRQMTPECNCLTNVRRSR